MRVALVLLTLIFSLSAGAQNEVDRIMLKATCECIDKVLDTATQNGDSFIACYLKSVGKDTLVIKSECKRIYGDTTAEVFSRFGSDFFRRNAVDLVYSCDPYFRIMDSIRYAQIRSLDKDSVRVSIASLNLISPDKWNKDFLATRGLFYFALGDYDNAQKDLDAALAIDSGSVQALLFRGWIFEIRKDYDNAIRLYTELARVTQTNEFRIFAAIAKRKKENS